MKNYSILLLIIIGLFSYMMTSCFRAQSEEASKGEKPEIFELTDKALIARGEYLVNSMGCDDCHSPKVFGPKGPEPDPERRLSGHPQDMALPKVDTTLLGYWAMFSPHMTATLGPWGASFSANLTSDPTGIGNWSEEQFFRAIREGKSKGLANNRDLLPPMPWFVYKNLTDEDLRAIFAYLKTVKPVRNVPPPPMSMKEISQ